ncbi:Pentatricopeptide repeat-containing protein, partial [Drosera capensis]
MHPGPHKPFLLALALKLEQVGRIGTTMDAYASSCMPSTLLLFQMCSKKRCVFFEIRIVGSTLVEGAMINYTSEGMQIAQDTLVAMTQRNLVLTARMGSDLLRIAAGEKTGGYTTANYLWDLMQSRRLTPNVDVYFKGLKEREIPEDDPRLIYVSCCVRDKFISRFR